MNGRITSTCLLLAIVGCGGAPEPPRGAGARVAATNFFDAIARQEWSDAFETLDPDSRKNWTLTKFSERAKSYRKNLSFEPAKVHVRLCEEQGDKANAHVVLTDANDSQKTAYRDAVVLRKNEAGWRVILPANFGVKK